MRALVLLAALLGASCGGSSPAAPASTPITVTRLALAGPNSYTARGQTGQLTATATLSNGDMQDQTRAATWASSRPDIATVSATGLVTALATGSATVTATFQGVSASGIVGVSIACEINHTAAVRFENTSSDQTYTILVNTASLFTLAPKAISQFVDEPADVVQTYRFQITNTNRFACSDAAVAFAQCSTQTISCP
jgi:hypothetical protein